MNLKELKENIDEETYREICIIIDDYKYFALKLFIMYSFIDDKEIYGFKFPNGWMFTFNNVK